MFAKDVTFDESAMFQKRSERSIGEKDRDGIQKHKELQVEPKDIQSIEYVIASTQSLDFIVTDSCNEVEVDETSRWLTEVYEIE